MLEYTLEQSLNEKGYTYVCGVDEAGRGPLCGPVVAAACILPVGLYMLDMLHHTFLENIKPTHCYRLIDNNNY